jgi:5'-methylthioadenosine phosphorylase
MLGIIGGTGLYKIDSLKNIKIQEVSSPFGHPSSPIHVGTIHGYPVAFLPRHGVAHEYLPSEINYRANIWALKSLGVRQVISVSAVGSLSGVIHPGDLAVPSQYFDWTRGKRVSSFFGDGIVAHVSTAEPTCKQLTKKLQKLTHDQDFTVHFNQTYGCVEGPRLGTRAESHFLKNAGCQLVGMTNVPEVFLAREAQLCYCTLAIVTDFDCWMDDSIHHVQVEQVMVRYQAVMENVKQLLESLILSSFSTQSEAPTLCECQKSLKGSVLTHLSYLSREKKQILEFLNH